MASITLGFLSMFRSQSTAVRKLTAMVGVNDLSNSVSVLFDSPQCATSGIYQNAGVPAAVATTGSNYSLLLDTIKFNNGSVVLSSLPDPGISTMIQPYTLSGLTFTSLGGDGPDGTGFIYPFKMTVTFSAPSGPPPAPLSKHVLVYTNAAKTVVGTCTNRSAASGPTTNCPHSASFCDVTTGQYKMVSGPLTRPVGTTPCGTRPADRHWYGNVSCPPGYQVVGGGANCQIGLGGWGGTTLSSQPNATGTAWLTDCCVGETAGVRSSPSNNQAFAICLQM